MIFSVNPERDWLRLGNLDPYYGVISDAKLKSEAITDEQKQLFFDGGAAHAEQVIETAASLFGVPIGGEALDFGCGVGRIALGLAPFFTKVVGVDISPGMLAEARNAAAARNVGNVDFEFSHRAMTPETYDFVHTFIVMQHIPRERGEEELQKLVRATKIGGIGAIHLLLDRPKVIGYRARQFVKNVVPLRQIGNIAARRPWNYPAMQMNEYSFPRILEILSSCGVENFTCHRVDDWGHVGVFLFYRRAARTRVNSVWSNPVH